MSHLSHPGLCLGLAIASLLITSTVQAEVSEADLEHIRERYLDWVLDTPQTDYRNPHVNGRYDRLQRYTRRIQQKFETEFDFADKAPLYDTRIAGDDQREMSFLVTEILPHLSTVYSLPGPEKKPNPFYHDQELRRLILLSFDRLHQRGFREGMLMPWKAKEVADQPSPAPQAIIVDFHLRTSGFALATFLMREELANTGKLDRHLQTCRDIMGHDEKFGSLYDLKQNADGIRLVANFALPYALAAGDLQHLDLIRRQVDRSMAKESDASDTIKPDGLGFHHRAVYLSGYAPYGIAQSAFLARLFDGTGAEVSSETIANISRSFRVLRLVSQKYDMHKALSGRLTPIPVIPQVMMGYGYLADLEHPERPDIERILNRLADEAFMASPESYRVFSAQRNEIPPGPGAIADFYRILTSIRKRGAEPDPSGNWAFNYGALSIHRRDNWMVSVKGYSKYWWAFERSLVDARMDTRLQNVLGFHDSACHIRIHSNGSPVNAIDSGYSSKGWDWCRIPGGTTRLIPGKDLLEMDRASERTPIQRPFGESAFVGGLSLDQKNGLFAMQYHEVGPDRRKGPLRAMKSLFFFGDHIVAITHNIKNSDGVYPVATTLYQTQLPETDAPTWVQGKRVTGSGETRKFDDDKPLALVDSAGNGYYIPRADKVQVRRCEQTKLDQSGTTPQSGHFATAWFDHGKNPDGAACEFVILPAAGAEKTQAFAKDAHSIYTIRQQNSRGIIVEHHPLGIIGYVLPLANTEIGKGLISQVSAPCFAMTKALADYTLRMSVCNPDLGWEQGKQFDYKKHTRDPDCEELFQAVPMPVTLTLRGLWGLSKAHPEVTLVQTDEKTTRLTLTTSDARGIEFRLTRQP